MFVNIKIAEAQTILNLFDYKESISNAEISNLRQEEKNLFLSLPKVDKSRIDKMKKDLLLVQPSQVMENFMGSFTYSMPTLEFILSIFKPDNQIPKTTAIYIFVSIISYLFYHKTRKIPYEYLAFFNALFRTINVPALNQFSTYFFHDLLIRALNELSMDKWGDELIVSVCNYILFDTQLTASFYPTLESFCNLVFTKDSEKSNDYLLTTIGKLYQAKSNCILIEDQSGMIQLLEPFAIQVNPHIFEIISSISQISTNNSVKNIYLIFLNMLYKQITVESQKIQIEQRNPNHLIIPDVEIDKHNDFQFIENKHATQFFSKGLSAIPSQLSDSIDIWSIVSKEFDHDITTFSTFLQKSHVDCTDFFFQGLSKFLASNQAESPSTFLIATMAIIRLLKNNQNSTRRDLFMSFFITNNFFNSSETIFDDNGLNVYYNLYRNHIISFLMDQEIGILLHNYFNHKQYLFYIEIIGRVLALRREKSILESSRQHFFNDVFDLSLIFQSIYINHIHSPKIYEARSILFSFMIHMASYSSFRDENCLEVFGHFFFEIEIQKIALNIFKRNLVISENRDNLIHFIKSLLSKCIEYNSDKRYFDLFDKILDSLNEMISTYHQISEIAICLFDLLMRCFKAFPDRVILIKMLKMTSLLSYLSEAFDLSNDDKIFISQFIRNNNIVDSEVYSLFMSLLFNYPTFSPPISDENDVCFIEKSKFITLFCSSFCKSELFLTFLEVLSISCQHSPFVSEKCHDGSLDFLLLEYLQSNSTQLIEYENMIFELKFSKEFTKRVIKPLLISILQSKASCSIVYKLLKLCEAQNSIALSIFKRSIASCSMMIHPLYLISSHKAEVTGCTSRLHLNIESTFSFTFWLKLDFLAASQLKPEICFFKATDNISTIQVTYNLPFVTFYCENSKILSSTRILLPITEFNGEFGNTLRNSSRWHFIGLVFTPMKDNHSINVFVNGKALQNTVSVPLVSFSNTPLNIELGNVNILNSHGCNNFGFISDFMVFDKALKKSDLEIIYRNNLIKKRDYLLLLNSLTEFYRSKNILDAFSTFPMLSQYVKTFRNTKNIDFLLSLGSIFECMPISQRLFLSLVNNISDILKQIKDRNYHHYSSMFSIFEKITNLELQISWLDAIILNIQLWMACDMNSIQLIIQHWYSVILVNYASAFQSCSWFSNLFIEIQPYIETKEELRPLFDRFLTCLAMIKFDERDTRILFDAAFSSAEKVTLSFYLKLLKTVSHDIKRQYQIECLNFLHTLLRIKTKTVEYHKTSLIQEEIDESYCHDIFSILEIINELEVSQSSSEAIILSQELLTSKELNIVLSQIMSNISSMPKFCPLVFCLLSSIQQDDLINIPKTIWQKQFLMSQLWFIWPLHLAMAYDHNKEQQTELIKNMARATINSKNKIIVMQNICLYGKLLQSVTLKNLETNFIYIYLSELSLLVYENLDVQFIVEMVTQFLFAVFIHLNWKSHSSQLMDLLKNSPFNREFDPIDNSIEHFDITEISKMYDKAYLLKKIKPRFSINLAKNNKIDGYQLLQKATSFLPILKEKHEYEQLIKHFSMGKNGNQCNVELCDKLTKEFSQQFLKYLSYDFQIFNHESNQIEELFQNMLQFDFAKYEKNLKDQLMKNVEPIQKANTVTKFRRSRSAGTNRYPNKLKTDFSKKYGSINSSLFYDINFTVNSKGDDLNLSYQRSKYNFFNSQRRYSNENGNKQLVSFAKVNWISVTGNKIADFKIFNNEVRIIVNNSVQKVISKNDIDSIWITTKSTFEIYLINGRSYLFDVSPSPNSIIKPYFDSNLFVYSLDRHIKWKSNFEYLLYLNFLIGRSFNNLNNYPIFPRIINSMIPNYENPIPPPIELLKWNADNFEGIDLNLFETIECNVFYPEFFYFPELFKSDSYCKSLDFVYHLRKVLESEQISKFLPSWIDHIFGIKSENANPNIFQVAHPPKPRYGCIKEKQTLKIPISLSLVISSSSFSKNQLLIATESNQIVYTNIIVDNNSISLQTRKAVNPQITKKLFVKCFDNMNTIVFDNDKLLVHIFKEDSQILMRLLKCIENNIWQIKFANSDTIVFLEDKCTLRFCNLLNSNLVSEKSGRPPTFSSLYNDFVVTDEYEIALFDVSARFSIFVYVTINNEISFCSMSDSKQIRKNKINKNTTKLLITDNWGFVILYSPHYNHLTELNQINNSNIHESNETAQNESNQLDDAIQESNEPAQQNELNELNKSNIQKSNEPTQAESNQSGDSNGQESNGPTQQNESTGFNDSNIQESNETTRNESNQLDDSIQETNEQSQPNESNEPTKQNELNDLDDANQINNESNELNDNIQALDNSNVPSVSAENQHELGELDGYYKLSNSKLINDGIITVYSLNGELIAEYDCPFVIKYWKSISSIEGFDYVIFQDDCDVLRIFEAIRPDRIIELTTIENLVDVHYLQESNALLFLTKFGEIIVHPISIQSLFD